MKRLIILTIFIFTISILINGCSPIFKAPVVPPFGSAYNNTSAPIETTFNQNKIGPKRGTASTTTILSLFAFGDSSVYEAAKNGNIKVVNHIDAEWFNVLGIYVKYTTVVLGE